MEYKTVIFAEQLYGNSMDVARSFVTMWSLRQQLMGNEVEIFTIDPEDSLNEYIDHYFPMKEESEYSQENKLHEHRLTILQNEDGFTDSIKKTIKGIKQRTEGTNKLVLMVICNVYDQRIIDKIKDDQTTVIYFKQSELVRIDNFNRIFKHHNEDQEEILNYIYARYAENGNSDIKELEDKDAIDLDNLNKQKIDKIVLQLNSIL